jgi:phospholipase/carboxylesterase
MADRLHLGADLAQAKAVCVFVHGRGQSPEEMADHVIRHLPQDHAYLLPRAPGGAWYAARAVDPLTDATRAELAASLAQLRGLITAIRSATPAPLVLAGFSQGACLSLELACTGLTSPDTLVAFTGCRLGKPSDTRPHALPRGLPVYLTGGDADPWIPVSAFAEAMADLGTQGASLRADLFPGRGHEVSAAERAMLSTILSDLASGNPPGLAAPR